MVSGEQKDPEREQSLHLHHQDAFSRSDDEF